MRAIKIDPSNREITEIEISKNHFLEEAYQHMECSTIDMIYLGGGVDLVVDDEGLLREPLPNGFQFKGLTGRSPIYAGTALLVSNNGHGDTIALDKEFTLEVIRFMVIWVDADKLPKPEFSIVTF